MIPYFGWFVFVLGLVVGSFLNAVIHRLHTGQSIVRDTSRCPHCGHKLAAIDLVPVISFFVLGGKCRYCKKPISWTYPLVEFTTALAFLLIYLDLYGSTSPAFGTLPRPGEGGGEVELLFQLIFVSFLIIIFVYDLKHYLILDKVVFPAAALAAIYQFLQGNFWNGLLGAAVLAGFFGLLYFVSKGK
ncbi:MAG: prepilin peptidase, partial [bacterium]|nr:prepilin peptidase [bacterium]